MCSKFLVHVILKGFSFLPNWILRLLPEKDKRKVYIHKEISNLTTEVPEVYILYHSKSQYRIEFIKTKQKKWMDFDDFRKQMMFGISGVFAVFGVCVICQVLWVGKCFVECFFFFFGSEKVRWIGFRLRPHGWVKWKISNLSWYVKFAKFVKKENHLFCIELW